MTLHSRKQIQNYRTEKLCENVAMQVLILGWQKTAKCRNFHEIFDEIRIL